MASSESTPIRPEDAGTVGGAPSKVRQDVVEFSPAVAIANAAVKSAAVSTDVRPEAVARAKALLEAGQVGQDLDALADKIIDSLLDS